MKRLLILFALVLSGCSSITGNVVQDYIPEESSSFGPEVHFCSQEDCIKFIIGLISNKNKVDCAFYELTDKSLIEKLEKINARVVVHDNQSGHPGLMHNKFCIIDDSIVITGSFNPTKTAALNDNNLLVINSAYLAENYNQEFDELLRDEFARGEKARYNVIYLNGKRIENYFCPEDSCEQNLLRVLSTANKSIRFMVFSFSSDAIANKLIEKHIQGVDVSGVTEKFQSKYSQFDELNSSGIDIKYDSNKNIMHHKVFIVDEKIVVTGSYNPTSSADRKNDENMLILFDQSIASDFLAEFVRVR